MRTTFGIVLLRCATVMAVALSVGLAATTAADAAKTPGKWTVNGKGKFSYACLNDDYKRVSGAKYCHNCLGNKKRKGGDRVRWKIPVACNLKKTDRHVTVIYICHRNNIPPEGTQYDKIMDSAKADLEKWKKGCPNK